MTPLATQQYDHNIFCLDAEYVRPGLASCYLIEENGHAVLIDTGTVYTVPAILKLLEQRNIALENVDYIIPTHVHLDHAGGAGELMRILPNAHLLVHPRGARHMVDPSKLQAGASVVYGEAEFKKHYGDLTPIPKDRVSSPEHGETIDFQGRPLTFLHTPGHAKHHLCIIDPTSDGMFTGDTFGVAYPELSDGGTPYIFPPSSPVDFDPEHWLTSIDMLMATNSTYAYLTHYGRVGNLQLLANTLRVMIKDFANFAITSNSPAELEKTISNYMLNGVFAGSCPLSEADAKEVLEIDIDLITQGLGVWIEKKRKKA